MRNYTQKKKEKEQTNSFGKWHKKLFSNIFQRDCILTETVYELNLLCSTFYEVKARKIVMSQ